MNKRYIEGIFSLSLGVLMLLLPLIPVIGFDVSGYDTLEALSIGGSITAIGVFVIFSIIASVLLIAMGIVIILNVAGIVKTKLNLSLINFIVLAVASVFALCILFSTIAAASEGWGFSAYSIVNLLIVGGVTVADALVWKKLK